MHTEVVKFAEPSSQLSSSRVVVVPSSAATARVARDLLQTGSATVSELAERLGLTATAIRRHLDALLADGLVTAAARAPYGPAPTRGRGRPARVFAITEAGRDALEPADSDLAVDVLRYLAETQGPQAIRAFAQARVATMEQRYAASVAQVSDPQQRLQVFTDVLTADGYAAAAMPAAGTVPGAQMCQHRCPVAHAAAEFPQLCEAETELFSRILGTHVLRLATIAHGDGVCTTHIPAVGSAPPFSGPSRPSAPTTTAVQPTTAGQPTTAVQPTERAS